MIRLQPNETIRLYCLAKQPGEGMNLASVHLDLAFDQFFKEGQMEAYQRLLLDVINGRLPSSCDATNRKPRGAGSSLS